MKNFNFKGASKITFPSEDIINSESKFATINDSIVFRDGKYKVIEANSKMKTTLKLMEGGLILINVLVGYKFATSLLFLRPLKSVFYGGLLFFTMRGYYGIADNKKYIIDSIYLLEDGLRVQVQVDKKTITSDIKDIRRLKQNEGMFFTRIMPQVHEEFFPIIIDKQFYLIPKLIQVYNSEILSIITNGKYIQITETHKIESKKKIIDI